MILRQIEKIQKLVNYLLGLCTEVGADTESGESFECREDKYESLGVMILKAQDGLLSARSYTEMNRQLMNEAEALHFYVDFQQLTGLLYFHFNPSKFHINAAAIALSGSD